ncbi:hypothetical protein EXE48_04285 [Halorubrum sp. ASP1]|uniref:sulfatase-like hydrolase/transferase n=1 Tax=Halorubrum sp. ASP1 TaxID=2518114 RepID=UPI0010F6E6C4|nr:sulfatase-like hydrolase/transferase [Halorubrum sp. ASP1]TKX62983.1 hypothetical protein EXE48_04285 [Halorubrum sp. ASP1]
MNIKKLTNAFRDLSVTNVFIYVGDAIRADLLPEHFGKQDTVIRAIASSTHSPASFASLVTGCYPPTHGVRSFNDRLPDDITRLFDVPGVDNRFMNSIFAYATEYHGNDTDPIHSVLNTDPVTERSPFDGLEPPFITMERGPGGHAPYGDHTGTAVEYFESKGSDRQAIEVDYERSVELDIEWFNARVDELDELGYLEDTLVVYTSDHGELLGEGGTLGHNDPMRPELVYVPTVFRHPDLPNGDVTETSFHHVDIFPTVLTALNYDTDQYQYDGLAPKEALSDKPRPCFWENQFLPDRLPGLSGMLKYNGVWNSTGGRVWTDTSRVDRYAVLIGKLFRSSKRRYMRRHLGSCIAAYWSRERTFGTPSFDREEAKKTIEQAIQNERSGRRTELSNEEMERLRDLGYLN